MLNQVTLVGRITANPKLKKSASGRPFCIVNIATARSFKSQETGEYETDFIDASLWGITAENVVRKAGKGSAVAIRGRLANRILEIPNEQTFKTISVVGERVSFIQLCPPEVDVDNVTSNDDSLTD